MAPPGSGHHYYAYSVHAKHWRLKLHQTEDATIHRSYGWSHDPEVNQYATNLTDLAWPVLQNLGFSGLVGIVCAVAFKVGIMKLEPST